MHKLVAATLISVFENTIAELTAKLQMGKFTMSHVDFENANYVVLMAGLNLFNTKEILSQGDEYYANNTEKVERFLTSASGFADSLLAEGYGMSPNFGKQILSTKSAHNSVYEFFKALIDKN